MSQQYRWCIFCEADCYVSNPEHNFACPISTGLWPVSQSDYDMDMCCGMCPYIFELDDCYMHVDIHTHKISSTGDILEVVCIGCATAISILGVKYE